MDVHVHRAITLGLRMRDVDVLTAQEDNHRQASDSDLLDRATMLGRVLFSQDQDLLAEANYRQTNGIPFGGVIYAHQRRVSIGNCVHDLALIAGASDYADFINRVEFLPL
jgi:hypothetical protein